MKNDRLIEMCRPYYPIWTSALDLGWTDMVERRLGRVFIGNCHRVERAGMAHAFMREALRITCEELDPMVTLVQEPDGRQLEYLLVRNGDDVLAVRWGRYDPAQGRIKRNDTLRQMDMRGQGYIWADLDMENEGIRVVTLGYELDQDYTEMGQTRAYIRRILLLRERVEASEILDYLWERPRRSQAAQPGDSNGIRITLSDDFRVELEREARRLRRKLG